MRRLLSIVVAVVLAGGIVVAEDKSELFEIRRYDSTWWTIKWLGAHPFIVYNVSPQITVGPGWPRNPLVTDSGWLTGNHLFKITPSNLLG